MTAPSHPPDAQMMQFILGKWISRPVHTAAELRIADLLIEGPQHVNTLAERTGTKPELLCRLLRALASVGIFRETEDGIFEQTPLSESLQEGRLRSAAMMFHATWHDAAWAQLTETLRSGTPGFELAHRANAFDWFAAHPDDAKLFNQTNAMQSLRVQSALLDQVDFSRFEHVIDAGGGLGDLLIRILRRYPSLHGTVAEREDLLPEIKANIARHDLSDRMDAVACDILTAVPPGGDAIMLSHILHDWSDDDCLRILRSCRTALAEQGILMIAEAVIPPGNDFSPAKLLDLEVLVMGGGKERSEQEFRRLLAQGGFRDIAITSISPELAVIEARPSAVSEDTHSAP
mgnify:CR=1 FL=1